MANDDLSQLIRIDIPVLVTMVIISAMLSNRHRRQMLPREPSLVRDIHRNAHMSRILDGGIHNCVEYIRMSKDTFLRLCTILRGRGHLRDTIHVMVEEQVALFLHIVGHHEKIGELAASINQTRKRTWKEKLTDVLWDMEGYSDDDMEMVYNKLIDNKKEAENFYLRKPSLRKRWMDNFIATMRNSSP